MAPIKSSLARTVGKLLGVQKTPDLSLRGNLQNSRKPPVLPLESSGGTAYNSTPKGTIHRFTSSGSFICQDPQGNTPTVNCTILVVGGGGAGGSFNPGAYGGGGGGGGGVRYIPSITLNTDFAETEVDCFVYCRRIDYPFLPSVLLTKPGGYQGIYQLALHRSRDVYLAESKSVLPVAKSVISNMNQSYLENIQCMHALSSSIIDTVPCKRNIEDNLHIKDSYEFISNMRSRSLFDFDIEKLPNFFFIISNHFF